MPAIEQMTLEEIELAMTKMRERRRALKKTGKAAERKIATLERRRERFMEQVHVIDAQIQELQREASEEAIPAAPRRRGRRPKSATIALV